MKQKLAIGLVCALMGLGACGKSSGGGGGIDKETYDKMMDSVHGGDAWDKATAAVEKVMGPAKLKTDAQWTYAVDDGTDCYDVQLLKNGDKVAGVGGGKVNKAVEKLYTKCSTRAQGKQP